MSIRDSATMRALSEQAARDLRASGRRSASPWPNGLGVDARPWSLKTPDRIDDPWTAYRQSPTGTLSGSGPSPLLAIAAARAHRRA